MIKIKEITFLVLSILMATSCVQKQEVQEQDNELKVLSWNIWHAGHSKAYPEKGCEGTIGILKKSKADVILMIETYGASDKVADSLGFYHRLISSNLSIYSRYPIIETYTFPDSISTFNFGGVMINKGGKKIRVFNTWLHYLPDINLVPTDKSEAEILAWDDAGSRDDEVRKILSVLKPYIAESDSIPILMGGDFNSHSHLDWSEVGKNIRYHNGAVVNWTVSSAMQQAGFTDSFREINPNPADNNGATWLYMSGGFKDNPARIDYIYYMGKGLKAASSVSYNAVAGELLKYRGDDFFYPSDHGFVETTFRTY